MQIATIQNEPVPGLSHIRPPIITALSSDRKRFVLGETGFHQVNQVLVDEDVYYIDALVFSHHGSNALDGKSYFDLFEYPDGVEITKIEIVR